MATFRERMASRLGASTASNVENWDDDGDFEGTLFTHSMSTIQSSISSRVSVRSESNTGDEEWQLLLTPNDDEISTTNAITAAKRAGIPIPNTAPSSALLGGPIKRLGTKKSNRKIDVDDDWGNDLVLPDNSTGGLKLKAPMPHTPADDNDDLDWGEGSLGIRFAGTRRDTRGGRSSSVSAMSPSMGSCMTLESEDDDLTGLVLPNEPLDFNARLEKLKRSEPPTPDVSPLPGLQKREPAPTSAPTSVPQPDFSPTPAPVLKPSPILDHEPLSVPIAFAPPHNGIDPEPKPRPVIDEEDFLDGLDFGADEVLDTKKLTLNRNVVVKKPASKPAAPPAARPATTITFTDKPSASRIPRPLSTSRSRLTPVYETGASTLGHSRPMPTTTSAQLLRAKRSAPLLRNTNYNVAPRTQAPFLPAGASSSQSHHVKSKTSQTHLRRDSDPRRPQSPALRSYSRMSGSHQAETPSRASIRRDQAPSALGRHSLPQKLTHPQGRKKNYGDGSELELFDDLPTSATKEKQYEKVPRNVPSNKSLRTQPSNSRLPTLDRISTPLPQTPRSPTKMDSTPRFARDTAASRNAREQSRNAREQRLAGTRSRGEGPIAPPRFTNWQAQIAARSPRTSPTAHRKKGSGQKPHLIKPMSQPHAKNEKGMVYNPTLQRWEGNEDALAPFSQPNTSTTTLALTTASTPTFAPPNHPFHPSHDRSHSISHTALSHIQAAQRNVSSRAVKVAPAPSPPRPALISQISAPRGVQYEGRMVFDPVKMTWMKAPRLSNDPRSPSLDMDDDEDPFAGLDDLKDNESVAGTGISAGGAAGNSGVEDPSFVGEEFDLGPSFIRRQREEEAIWRRKVEGWVGGLRDNGAQRGGWRWAIRDFAASASAEIIWG